ncbi:MAG: hypothetical protein ROZ37_17885 [Aromatoleum sp.]|jgi:hypothetical protein|uniref:hypothetical protein n=1 Tax=Aromatoleum sp. TaxID=2307007 RepID=UPI002895BC76|nr:hypothetical protein [Aromatoleum sp.]MDT3672195.1 hypothetical protein [Aromatoleum sp.]
MKKIGPLPAALLAALALPAAAGEFSASVGMDYSSGDYGTNETSETWYVPVVGKYEDGRLGLKLTVPYLRITNPSVGPDGEPLPCGNARSPSRKTESGLGDVVGAASYALLDGTEGGVLLDVVGKVKLPTADEDKCLGTGKTDYSLQFDAAKAFGGVTGFGTLGWKKFGDPSGAHFRDPIFGSVGLATKLAPATTVGAAYDWRQKVTSRGDEISEMSLFVSHTLDPAWKLQFYAVKGFSDASPDWGSGLIFSRRY